MKNPLASRKDRAIRALWLSELALILLSVLAAAWIRFINDPVNHQTFAEHAFIRGLIVAVFITGAMAAFGLYQVHVRHNRMDFILRLALSFAFGGMALLVLYYALPQAYIGRGVMAMSLLIGLVGVVAIRLLVMHVFSTDVLRQRVLVLGAGKNADLINSRMRRDSDRRSFVVVGFVPVPGQPAVINESMLIEPGQDLLELAQQLQIDEIVIAPDERRGGLPMEEMLACVQRGISIIDLSTFFEREAGMVQLNVLDPSWLMFSGGFDYSTPRRLSKRFFDLAAAVSLLLVAWPFMLLVALLVWLEDGSPILYRQVRVGERGQHFELIKFRSMRVDAEKDGVARWATKDDDRSTRIGRFIRLTRLDELPQLFAVIMGNMSFVGPRPERPHFVDMLSEEIRYYGVRHCVKPGLTGWAQLRYPYGASVRDAEEKLKFDLFYVKNHGLVFDLMIMLQTVEVVLFGRGAR
jgi:sugar transferase (PEP-CTERM system associated)